MKTLRRNVFSAAVLSCFAGQAAAEDELVLHAFRNGTPAATLTASLDGGDPQKATPSGSFMFDLQAGPHSVRLLEDGKQIHVVRFDVAAGQNVDIAVALSPDAPPKVEIEPYLKNESVTERAGRQPGSVTGRVLLAGAPLDGARIAIRGTPVVITSAPNGVYALELPRGSYTAEVSHPSLDGAQTQTLRVIAGIDRSHNIALENPVTEIGGEAVGGGVAVIDEIIVTARPRPRGENEQTATSVIDVIDAEQLARAGGSDVAASVIRVPSITVQDDRFVFIRGLGDRYITTTLNGATMPSTDPNKRTVPLDLFPSNIVSQLDVKKTFIANMPGESTGGNLVINTRTFPSEAGGNLSATIGMTTGLTGKSVYTDPTSGAWDYFGVDDGSRKIDGLVPLIATALDHSDEYSNNTLVELQRVGGLLIKDGFDLDKTTAWPKGTINLNYGDVFDLGDEGARFGYFAAANFANSWEQRDEGVARTYSAAGDTLDNFKFVEQTNTSDASALLSLGLNIGSNSYASTSLMSRSTESRIRVSDGIDGDANEQSHRYTMDWIERQFLSQQLSGQHAVLDMLAKWQVTASQAKRYSPDRREVRFDMADASSGVYNLEVPFLLHRYDELIDDNLDLSTDWNYDFDNSKISWGAQLITRSRDADSASYGYTGGQTAIDDSAPNVRVDDVITSDNITGDPSTGYAFQDKTLLSDSYKADLDLYAGYVSYDLRLGDYQFIVGGRYEQYKQTTDTVSLETQIPVQSKIDEGIFLPSFAFNWYMSDENQLRAAVSRTVARPDFKETSNATFYDQEFNFRVRGNPNLKVSEVTNFDIRWEKYWSRSENLSLALFYKDLKDPIERVVLNASGTAGNSRTFQNADSAEIYGIEVDTRKEFSSNEEFTRSFFVAANASYIESKVQLADNGGSRKLQGQPDYTVNFIVGYDDIPTGQEVTLLLNQNGKAIQDVGILDLPNIIEQPRLSLNMNYRYELMQDFAIKFKATNLLDAKTEFSQGGKTFQSYRRGIELEAGFDWNF